MFAAVADLVISFGPYNQQEPHKSLEYLGF